MQLYLGLTLKKIFFKTLNDSHEYDGGISMIYFSSGNMEKILENNLLNHLTPLITLSNLVENGEKKK